jgi:hypothetical protein
MKISCILVLVLSILILSCTNKIVDKRDISIDINNKENFIDLLNYLDGEVICLESNENCLIGQIDKVRITEDYIFVLDRRIAKAIFIFDRKGCFIRKFDKNGKGEGECLFLADFDLYDGVLYILSGLDRKILLYDYVNDGFIKEIKLTDHGGYNLKVLSDQKYMTVRANSILRVDFWNSKGKLTKTILDEKFMYLKWKVGKAISSNINGNYICSAFENKIYKADDSKISQMFHFDFLKNSFPFEGINSKEEFFNLIDSRKYCRINSFSISDNYLIFSFAYENVGFGIYNIKSNKVEIADVFLYDGIPMSSIVGDMENGFILSQDAPTIFQLMTYFKENNLHSKYSSKLQSLEIDDNPVLFLLN